MSDALIAVIILLAFVAGVLGGFIGGRMATADVVVVGVSDRVVKTINILRDDVAELKRFRAQIVANSPKNLEEGEQ